MVKRALVGVLPAALMLLFSLYILLTVAPDSGNPLLTDATSWVLVGAAVLVVAFSGRWPGLGLAGLWLVLGLHWVLGAPFQLPEVGVLVVGFSCAAWGSRSTVVLSLLSIPAVALALATSLYRMAVGDDGFRFRQMLEAWGLTDYARQAADSQWGPTLVLGLVTLLALSVPWLAGLALRMMRRSDESRRFQVAAEAERDEATEVARLRESQAQLSRDVHDVVGHSLTQILAHAEAGQLTQDPATLQRTLGTITETARSSLADVLQVLDQTTEPRVSTKPRTDEQGSPPARGAEPGTATTAG